MLYLGNIYECHYKIHSYLDIKFGCQIWKLRHGIGILLTLEAFMRLQRGSKTKPVHTLLP